MGFRHPVPWPYLAQVCRLERTVARKGETSRELAYAVTSLSPQEANPRQLLTLWRGHWGIENRVHWVRDVTLDEDRCQIRTGAAPQVMAALRNMTISLLSPNPPKDTDGRREESGRGVRELQGK